METILFFDTETTGLIPAELKFPEDVHKIEWPYALELSWVITTSEGRILKAASQIIRPSLKFDTLPEEIHGISPQLAHQYGKSIEETLEDFLNDLAFFQPKRFVAHNYAFDSQILDSEFLRLEMAPKMMYAEEGFCTMNETIIWFDTPDPKRPGMLKRPRLYELYEKLFGVPYEQAHRALQDTLTMMQCYFELTIQGIIPE